MANGDYDVSDTLRAKSDQLNSADLIGGPITVQITKVTLNAGEQPVVVSISDGHQPWKPGKTMRRLLTQVYGADSRNWVGKWVTLYRDAEVAFGGDAVGGIRVSHMSHIDRGFTATLPSSRGKSKSWHVAKLMPPPTDSTGISDGDLRGWCMDAKTKREWTVEQITALLGGKAADVPPEKRADMVAKLKGPPPAADPPPSEPAGNDATF